jgi:hypothetical protein
MLAVLLPLGLAACADTMTSGQPVTSNTELLRDYDKTLTRTEQKAVISELQNEQAKRQGAASPDASASPAAKPAAAQN